MKNYENCVSDLKINIKYRNLIQVKINFKIDETLNFYGNFKLN